MTAYKGNSRKIKDGLKALLETLMYNGEAAFVKVTDNTTDRFEGSPNALILPSNLVSTTADSESFDHAVSFTVIVTWPLTDPQLIESTLFNTAMDYVDLITDAVQHADRTDFLTTNDPTFTWNFADVTQANWDAVKGKSGGAMLAVYITVTVTYSKNAA